MVKLFYKQYDDDWKTWLDLVDVRMLKHRETLCLILSEQEEGKKQVFTNSYLIECDYKMRLSII